VVEKIFFAKGAKAALSLGHARGIALLAAASENINLHECSALEVKKSVVGYGRAEKQQVLEMVKLILNVREPLYPDSADALALALCYTNTIKFNVAIQRS
jgi:crossover junction endodeoxyribonuclease RuvC